MVSSSEAISLDNVHSAQELFEKYSISQLSAIKFQLSKDVYNKKSELRSLVGSKYRDLLKVADNIIDMGQLSVNQNNDLVDLTFSKSKYTSNNTSTIDSNLKKFQSSILSEKLNTLEKSNNPIILRNLIHDLKKSILELSQTLSEINNNASTNQNINSQLNSNSSSQSLQFSEDSTFHNISYHFLIISKKFYLINDLFNLSSTTDYVIESKKLNQLKSDFLKSLKTQLLQLTVDNEFDFLLNLIISYILITNSSLLESFEFFLSTRYDYLVQNTSVNINSSSTTTISKDLTANSMFQENLSYIFNTLNYTEIFKSKLSTTLVKLFYSNNSASNWLSTLPIFKKWDRWLNLNKYELKFSYSISDIKTSLNNKQVESEIKKWKLKIGNLFYNSFDTVIEKIDNINELTVLINQCLGSFKKFTSLIDLTYGDSSTNLLQSVLQKWELKFNQLIKDDLSIINETSLDISSYLKQSDTDSESTEDNDDLLFRYNENIDDYIFKITNNKYINNSISGTLQKIENCNDLLQSITNSLDSLNKLSAQLTKPILSIDDYEDDEFWSEFANDLNGKISKISDYKLDLIEKYLSEFFENSNLLVDKSQEQQLTSFNISNLVKFLRILIELSFRVSSNSEKNEGFKSTIKLFKVNENLSTLITRILQLIVKELSSTSIDEMKELYSSRYIVDSTVEMDIEDQFPEIQVWDLYGTENLRVPKSLSIDFQLILYSLCKSLITGQNGAEFVTSDYSDIYLLKEFNSVKSSLIDKLLSETITSLEKVDKVKKEEKPEAGKIEETVKEAEETNTEEEEKNSQVEEENREASSSENPLEIPSLLTYSDIITLSLLKHSITDSVNDIDVTKLNDPLLQKSITKLSEFNENLKSEQYRSVINRALLESFKSSTLMYNPLYN